MPDHMAGQNCWPGLACERRSLKMLLASSLVDTYPVRAGNHILLVVFLNMGRPLVYTPAFESALFSLCEQVSMHICSSTVIHCI